jgi:ribosome-binding factor A
MLRHEKVQEQLKKEVSLIIVNELKDPRLGFVTITKVELTADLRYAKIYFSVLGKDEDYDKCEAALKSGLGFIRRLVGQRIRLRFIPELTFRRDRSIEYSVRIQEVLNEIGKLNEPKKSSRVRKKE